MEFGQKLSIWQTIFQLPIILLDWRICTTSSLNKTVKGSKVCMCQVKFKMASGPSSLDNYLSCQICFENFQEDGDHVPRILPCHHTVCESCIKEMIRGNKIICPECREEHKAKKQEKSFQQNKYILVQMSRKKKTKKAESPKTDLCPDHKKEIIFFCEEISCKKPICKTCLTKEHKKHEVVEIEEKEKEELLKNIEETKKDLTEKIAILSKAKEDIMEKTEDTLSELEKIMEEITFMQSEVENKMKDMKTYIDNNVSMIEENILLLDQMTQNVTTKEDITLKSLQDGQETVAEVRNNINANICEIKTFNVKTFQANQNVDYGRFEEEPITIVLPEIKAVEETAHGEPLPIISDASELKWKGKNILVHVHKRINVLFINLS